MNHWSPLIAQYPVLYNRTHPSENLSQRLTVKIASQKNKNVRSTPWSPLQWGLIQEYSDMKFHRLRLQTHNQLNLNSLTMMTPYFNVLTSMNWPLLHISTTQRILEASLTCHYVTLNIPSSLLVNWLPHSVLSWHQIQNLMLTYIGNIYL